MKIPQDIIRGLKRHEKTLPLRIKLCPREIIAGLGKTDKNLLLGS
jgi:hypothetical protein